VRNVEVEVQMQEEEAAEAAEAAEVEERASCALSFLH
jgi:hypothetical protein